MSIAKISFLYATLNSGEGLLVVGFGVPGKSFVFDRFVRDSLFSIRYLVP